MKSKKILLGSLSAMALVATPIAAVVSCNDDKTADAKTDAKTDGKTDAKTDGKTDGKTGGKVTPVVQGPFVRKTTAADKGLFVAIDTGQGQTQKLFITEEEAKTETTITINGLTLVLPAMTKTSTNLKGKMKIPAAILKQDQDVARTAAEAKARTATPSDAAAITAAGDAAVAGVKTFREMPISAITSVVADAFVLNQRFVATNVVALKEMIQVLLTVENGKGMYKFEFTPASLQTTTPVLTTASDTAFKKIFTDLGLTLSHLVFEKTTSTIQIKSLDLA